MMSRTCPRAATSSATPVVAEEEPELPGLTGRGAASAGGGPRGARRGRAARSRCPAGGFGLPDLPQAGHRCRVGPTGSTVPRSRDLAGAIGRSLSRRNHGRSRAVVMAHDPTRRSRACARSPRASRVRWCSADGPVSNGPVWCSPVSAPSTARWARASICATTCSPEWINRWTALSQDRRILDRRLILDDSVDYTDETCQYSDRGRSAGDLRNPDAPGELLEAPRRQAAAVVGRSLGRRLPPASPGAFRLAGCHPNHLCAFASHGRGEAMLFGEYIRLMALVEYSLTRSRPCSPTSPTSRCASTPRRRRPSSAVRPPSRRDHRARREREQVRLQVPDQGRQPHPADGSSAGREPPPNCRASTRGR